MRLSLVLVAALMFTGQASFAKGGQAKQFHKMCKEENPGGSKSDIKKCVKEKMKEAKAAH